VTSFSNSCPRWLRAVWWRKRQYVSPELRGTFQDIDDLDHQPRFDRLCHFGQNAPESRRWPARRQSHDPVKYSKRALMHRRLQTVENFLQS
jgi:hypothetical protein